MHFYEQTGEGVAPRHFVPMKNRPDLRPTRITDVRKWWKEGRYVVPSVTTVLNVLNKAALNNWKVDQHLQQAYRISPDEFKHSFSDYANEVKRLTELQMDKAPTAGTNLHDSMEKHILAELDPDHEHYHLCIKVAEAIVEETGEPLGQLLPENQKWHPEVNFAKYGYGGQVDLVISEDWVIDYKTKQTAEKFKPGKMAYDEHPMQLSAYRNGLDLPNARCANVFVCLEDGQVDFHEHPEDDLVRGFAMFQHALELWHLQNRVESYKMEAAA